MAENEDEAAEIGLRYIGEECGNLRKSDLNVLRPDGCIWGAWESAHPYNSDDNRTVREIFNDEKEAEAKEKERIEWEKKQLKLFEDDS